MTDRPAHKPVLLDEVVQMLDPRAGETVVDCTAGLGGHASALAERIGPTGTLALNDLDAGNLARAAVRVRALPNSPKVVELRGNYADVPRRLRELGLAAHVVLADLGFSSNQVEDASRGLSFGREGPLDMRLDPTGPTTAAHLVNSLPEAELAELIQEFGEERHARRIARKLVAEREVSPIETTARLASILRTVVGFGQGIDPSTRTFQALRIAVNDELGSLRSLLESIARSVAAGSGGVGKPGSWLAPGARVGIISFHSLEDRPVKNAFSELVRRGLAEPLSKKPVTAGDAELADNPRARSAKFRAIRAPGSGVV
ncbi:MAG TPA: 16S rRNA (cytosine(1402)-N(4))-methyltransferase RsmH [Phycisphaerales bacterium]|nr:16S rRNA (cytosine(1402)-N(4))-methyltransferase RsmH [Phycisphaerales bacterium]